MTMFVRPATSEDSEKFAEWFSSMSSFRPDVLSFPDTYTLCAFTLKRVVGFMVVQAAAECQVLNRFVSNPESSDLEKAQASSLLVKQVITFGFINKIPEIYFMGDSAGTNRIAEHAFVRVPLEQHQHVFSGTDYPVYRLRLEHLCPAQ